MSVLKFLGLFFILIGVAKIIISLIMKWREENAQR